MAILSAIAYPYYRTAVWRSRVGNLIPLGRHLAHQSALYYVENGKWPNTYEMATFIPDRFKFEKQESEIRDIFFWRDKGVHAYCARGNSSTGDMADCRIIAFSIGEENWVEHMTLLFNARIDDTVPEDWLDRYEFACIASTFIKGPEYKLTHDLCRSLVGDPINEGSFVYVTK